MTKIRVLLADDHPIVRRGIRSLLQTAPDIDVVAEARSGVEALSMVEELRPDVHWIRVPDPDWPHPQGRPAIDVAAPALAPSNAA